MQKLILPHVVLPAEFLALLKTNFPVSTSSAPVFDIIRKNGALYLVLEKAFQEFDDGRGLEKTMVALGWSNFRERMASLFVYKFVHGEYPQNTSMELVEDIKSLEGRFGSHGVHGASRLFLLGFYLKLANLQTQKRENNKFLELKIPLEVDTCLRLSQGKAEKIDWLILILMHLLDGLGVKQLVNLLLSGKKFQDIYPMLTEDSRKNMLNNLLAYGASIREQENFLYEKI